MNTNNDKPTYILLKEVSSPIYNIPKGTEFSKQGSAINHEDGAYTYGNYLYPLHPNTVENNHEWFQKKESKKVKEQPMEITITNHKLDAMMETVFNAARERVMTMEHFFPNVSKEKYRTFKDYYDSLPENQQTNSNEYPKKELQEDKQVKEYEILVFMDGKNDIVGKTDISQDTRTGLGNKFHTIKTVKRLSDGEIFTIGDEVESTWGKEIIKGFIVIDSVIVEFETCRNPLREIYHVKKQQPTIPLFTAEDGVDIYDNELYYIIDNNYNISTCRGNKLIAYNKFERNTYWNKSAAEEYITLNKPCLSLKDIEDATTRSGENSDMEFKFLNEEKLKEIVSKKTNTP